jgi:hypothetical protein
MKSQLGYKSVERKKRKYEEILNIKKTYEYRKESSTHLSNLDNKENISSWANYVNTSSEAINKDHYTTPPFKSYKSKIPEKPKEVHTTSYRSRSNAYNDSTRSSLNMKQRKSKDSLIEDEVTPSYISHKSKCRDHFVIRREGSTN